MENTSSFSVYMRLLGYVKPYRHFFVISFIGFGIFAGTQAAFAQLMELLFSALEQAEVPDSFITRLFAANENFSWQIYVPSVAITIFVVRGLGTFLGTFYIEKVAQNLIHDLRSELFNKITVLKAQYLDSENSGHTISKITYNTQQVTAAATNAVKVLLREGLTVIGLLIWLFLNNWQLTLIFLTVGPILGSIIAYVSKIFRRYSKRIQESAGDITHVTTEAVQGFKVVRSFGGVKRERIRFQKSSQYNTSQALKLAFSKAISTPITQFIVAVAIGGIIFIMLEPSYIARYSGAELIAYVTAVALLPKSIKSLSEVNADLQKGLAAGESIFEILDEEEELHEPDYNRTRMKGLIEARDLSFSYDGSDQVLSKITFNVNPGDTIALVGRSGSGKSTLTNLLLRFYDGWDGRLEIDGRDVSDIPIDEVRANIAIVNQHVVLFNDTIANNIAYGELEGVDREAIIDAAKRANAWDFIQEQPEGLDTNIGEAGLLLSGGQRQRIAIARALLKDAPILILDEATSALDNESEKLIQDALKNASKNRTTIIIAHRLSTIMDADEILVMNKGRIIERGTHTHLLKANGYYSKLHRQH